MAARSVTVSVTMRNKLSAPAKRATRDLNALARSAQLSGHHFGVASDRYDKFSSKLKSGQSTLVGTSRATADLTRGTRDSSRALERQGRTMRRTSASAEASRVAMRRFRAANTITGVSRGLDRFRRKAVSAFGAPVSAALEFGKGIAEASTLTDEATFSTQKMERITLSMGKQFGGKSKQQVKALYDTISAGFGNATKATQVLTSANKLAVGGVTDVATAGDGLTTILNAYHLSASQSSQVTDTFFATVKAGKTTVPELSRSLGKVAPIAASLGIEFAELGGGIAALTAQGLSTSESVTGLRAALSNILKPSKQARIEARRLGVTFSSAGLQAAGGLGGLLKQIRASRKFNRNTLVKLFGSIRGVGAVTALTSENFEGLDKAMAILESREGSTTRAFDRINKTDFQNLKRAEANMEALKIELGKGITPALVDMARTLNTDVIPGVSRFLKENKDLIKAVVPVGIAIVGVSAVLSPLLLSLSSGITIYASYAKATQLAAAGSATFGAKTGVLAGKFAGKLGVAGLVFGASFALTTYIMKVTGADKATEKWLLSLTGINDQLDRQDERLKKKLPTSRKQELKLAREDLRSATKEREKAQKRDEESAFRFIHEPAIKAAQVEEVAARNRLLRLQKAERIRRGRGGAVGERVTEGAAAARAQIEANILASGGRVTARQGRSFEDQQAEFLQQQANLAAAGVNVTVTDERVFVTGPDGRTKSVPLSDQLALQGSR